MLRAFSFGLVCIALVAAEATAQEATEVRLTPQITARFASVAEAKEAITRRDDFTAALSTFDLQARLKTTEEVTVEQLLQLYADNVTPWPEEEVAEVTKALKRVSERLASFNLTEPKTVLLIRTTGQEEAGAAYCRGPAIVLPENMLRQPPEGLQRLLAHELFHVFSTQNPALRQDLYALIGFQSCAPVAWPKELKDRAITNPDAPRLDAYIELTLDDGEKVLAVPILIASVDKYTPDAKKSFFQYIQFKLLQVADAEGKLQPVLRNGQPVLIEPRGLKSYAQQIGKNTGYIIHPDEILADNFAHLVMHTEMLPSPEIIEKMRERLKK